MQAAQARSAGGQASDQQSQALPGNREGEDRQGGIAFIHTPMELLSTGGTNATANLSLRVPLTYAQAVDLVADQLNVSTSHLLRKAVEQYVAQHDKVRADLVENLIHEGSKIRSFPRRRHLPGLIAAGEG
jgi:hypothetical protein